MLCLRRDGARKKVLLFKRKKTFMQVTVSNPTLGMDKGTSNPEALFPAPQRLVRRSFIRSLATTAAAIMLVFSASGRRAQAAGGDLDPAFGTGGQVTTDFSHSTDIANAVALQPDGKLVVVGQTYKNNDYTGEDFAVARYNTDGTLDTTWRLRIGPLQPEWIARHFLWQRRHCDNEFSRSRKLCFRFGLAIRWQDHRRWN